jgi:K+-sensing histidine kinase KdpD
MAQRLQIPVASLHKQSLTFDRLLEPTDTATHNRLWREETPRAVGEVREAVSKIDAFLKALNRRASKQVVATPEWVDLHDMVQQEIELLEAEGILPQGLKLSIELKANLPLIFGVYDDFAETFSRLVQQGLSGPAPSTMLAIRSWNEDEVFFFEIQDQGGPIPSEELSKAFEPFQRLNQAAGGDVRMPLEGLTACNQFMSAYHGMLELRNEGPGTVARLRLPLR